MHHLADHEYGPPAPLHLWVYRYWHPVYRQDVTLDCCAITLEEALKSACRFMRREVRRAKRCGFKLRMPRTVYDMRRG
jgi:hypothetical protein